MAYDWPLAEFVTSRSWETRRRSTRQGLSRCWRPSYLDWMQRYEMCAPNCGYLAVIQVLFTPIASRFLARQSGELSLKAKAGQSERLSDLESLRSPLSIRQHPQWTLKRPSPELESSLRIYTPYDKTSNMLKTFEEYV